MEAATSPPQSVDRHPIMHDPCSSDNADFKGQGHVSCPKNVDDFLALYRHEDWSIQEFLDCLEDPKPSHNVSMPWSGLCSSEDPFLVQDNFLSDSAMLVPAAVQSTEPCSHVPHSFRDSLRVEIRRQQNRKSQQRYREKLKNSDLPHAPLPRKPKSRPQPALPNPDSASSCQRLHRARLTILGSRQMTEARIFRR